MDHQLGEKGNSALRLMSPRLLPTADFTLQTRNCKNVGTHKIGNPSYNVGKKDTKEPIVQNWEWLVPIIIVVIWIINHVLRGGDEERTANRSRQTGKQAE